MPIPDCRIYFSNGVLKHDPPLDEMDEFGNVIFNPTKEGLPRSRENGIAKMVESVIKKNNIKKDFQLHIRIADGPCEYDYGHSGQDAPSEKISQLVPEDYYSFCVFNQRYKKAFPDFTYVGFPETGLLDYTKTINSFLDTEFKTNKIGWIGSCSCGENTPRPKFLKMSKKNKHFLDGRELSLPLLNYQGWKSCSSRMSYQDQINEWKYLIDIEGCGYSGRFKILMNTPRIVFFVDRPYQEWFFEYMKPWVHYVPVQRDLSDLLDNYNKIESDLDLQQYIKENQKEFAKKYLTRDAAEDRIYEILKENYLQK